MKRFVVLVVVAATLPIWLAIASPNGDLFNRWTDHLRHEGEAIALVQHGPGIYGGTYDEATSGLTLPCDAHAGLWGQTGIPYPPLGVLAHAPVAFLERSGLFTPSTAHRLQVWFFAVAGLCCAAVGALHLRGSRRVLFLILFGPLLLGAGVSGFYDTLFVLAALLAISLESRALATLAFLLHFRGVLALSFVNWKERSRSVLLCALAIALNAAIAFVASAHLGVFERNSLVHYSLAQAWWFPAITALLWWLTRSEKFGWPLLVTAALIFTDRQIAFWHLLVLVPLAFSVLRSGSIRAVWLITIWMVITAQAYLDSYVPFPVQWVTQR